jgi:hypothetical protein
MEILQLALVLTDQDLNQLARKHLPKDFSVENLQFQLSPEGIHVMGEFPLFVPVSFSTLWQLGVRESKVIARLERINAFGLPVTVFRSMILKMIGDSVRKLKWLEHNDEVVIVDVDQLAAKEGVPLSSNLRSIECQVGTMMVRAGRE